MRNAARSGWELSCPEELIFELFRRPKGQAYRGIVALALLRKTLMGGRRLKMKQFPLSHKYAIRALRSLPAALERRRIAYPKAQEYASNDSLHQAFAGGGMGFNDKFVLPVRFGSWLLFNSGRAV
jgi:hypothetical protein